MIVFEFIAVFSCMIFAGASIYINIAEHLLGLNVA